MSQAPLQREKLLQKMEHNLATCRKAIILSVSLRSVYRMMLDMVLVLAIAAVAEILSSAVRWLLGDFYPFFSTGHGSVGITVAIVGACFMVVRAFRRIVRERPDLCETAERLDLAVDDHNRIATAWWLIKSGQQSPFVDAAIDDGLTHLKLFSSSKPDRSGSQPVLAEYRGRFLVAGLLLVLAILFQPGASYFPKAIDEPTNQVATVSHGILSPDATETINLPLVKRQTAAKPDSLMAPDQLAASASEDTAKLPGSDKETEGLSGRGKSSLAQSSSNASSANSSSSDSSSETKGELRKSSNKKKKSNKKKPHKESKPKQPQDSKGGTSSVSQGSSGGGSMLPVQHDWAQHAQAASSEAEDEFDEDDEEIDDDDEESQQRGGIQPTLKDRNESPSRELSISGNGDLPGTGRGGPSPPKKSRGTASMVLGVPVPDFVRGRLLAGPTKITQERVRPVPMGADPSTSTEAQRRTIPEPVVPRSTLPAEMLPLIREYMIRLHKLE